MMLSIRTSLLGFLVIALAACEQSAPDTIEFENVCAQPESLLDMEDQGILRPRTWGEMMLAGARVVYVQNDCGSRINAPMEQLCEQLAGKIQVFAEAPNVPPGEKRTLAINQGLDMYSQGGCQPTLDIK